VIEVLERKAVKIGEISGDVELGDGDPESPSLPRS